MECGDNVKIIAVSEMYLMVFACFRALISASHDTEAIHVAEDKEGC
jgi:hypothetical protein